MLKRELQQELKDSVFWTDSISVLGYIHNEQEDTIPLLPTELLLRPLGPAHLSCFGEKQGGVLHAGGGETMRSAHGRNSYIDL